MATFDPFLPSAKKQRVGGNQSVAELERVSATDMDARKRTTQVVCLAVAAQLLATAMFESIWSVVVPPLVAAVPVLLLTMRLPETVEVIAPKLRHAYAGAALVAVAVIALFAWLGDDLR
ncbi:MAG: hypothetical protein ACJ8FB_12575, partial [Sphingomicrobium sp.]